MIKGFYMKAGYVREKKLPHQYISHMDEVKKKPFIITQENTQHEKKQKKKEY
jgi:hypothetical protein